MPETTIASTPVPDSSVAGLPFESAAALVLGDLQSAFSDLLLAIPGGASKAADLERALAMDRKLCWQVYRVATANSPLSAGAFVPARASVQRLLKAASRRRLPPSLIERIGAAFDAFEGLVQQHAGDRAEFESLVAGALPELQDKAHAASREAIYQAALNIRGAAVEVSFFTGIFYPSATDPDRLDVARLLGWKGLRRIRRGARIEHAAHTSVAGGPPVTTLDGGPVNSIADVMLDRFCSTPRPRMSAQRQDGNGSSIWYRLEGDDVGVRSAVDAVMADALTAPISRWATHQRPTIGAAFGTDTPARRQILDILVCDGVAPTPDPAVRVYDIVPNGPVAAIREPERDSDIDPFSPRVRYMGRGIEAFRSSHVPRYEQMLAHVCQKRAWDPSRLHGYRVEIEYPVYSWQTVLALALPPQPAP